MEKLKKTDGLLSAEMPPVLAMSIKLAELEKNWAKYMTGTLAPLADKSAPASCEFTENGPLVTVNVSEGCYLKPAQARRAALAETLRRALAVEFLEVEIKVGRVRKPSTAKAPLPAYKRRAPVLISEDAVEKEAASLAGDAKDADLAEALARVRLLAEKRNARNT